ELVGGPNPAGDPGDEADERGIDFVERLARAAQRALCSDRPPATPRLNGPRISVVGERVEVPTRRATEERNEGRLRELGDLAYGRDPHIAELRGRHRPDSPEPLDRQRMEESELVPWLHEEQPVRLRHPA